MSTYSKLYLLIRDQSATRMLYISQKPLNNSTFTLCPIGAA